MKTLSSSSSLSLSLSRALSLSLSLSHTHPLSLSRALSLSLSLTHTPPLSLSLSLSPSPISLPSLLCLLPQWHNGGAWMLRHLVDEWSFHGNNGCNGTRSPGEGDGAALERLWPLVASHAAFYIDWLVEHPDTGKLVSGPSTSPENVFNAGENKKISVVMGPAMDQQIIKDQLTSTLKVGEAMIDHFMTRRRLLAKGANDYNKAAQSLIATRLAQYGFSLGGVMTELPSDVQGIRPFLDLVSATLKNLAPGVVVDWSGRILEWDERRRENEMGHRHMSHLYALFPGQEIDPIAQPDLGDAALKTIEVRLANNYDALGWSRGWLTNLMARLGEGEAAFSHIASFAWRSLAFNMFDKSSKFQIDGNFGIAAGITEMLIQSSSSASDGRGADEAIVDILPALPRKRWPSGGFKQLRARGGFSIDAEWAEEDGKTKIQDISIVSNLGRRIALRIHPPGQELTVLQEETSPSGDAATYIWVRTDTAALDQRGEITFDTSAGSRYLVIPTGKLEELGIHPEAAASIRRGGGKERARHGLERHHLGDGRWVVCATEGSPCRYPAHTRILRFGPMYEASPPTTLQNDNDDDEEVEERFHHIEYGIDENEASEHYCDWGSFEIPPPGSKHNLNGMRRSCWFWLSDSSPAAMLPPYATRTADIVIDGSEIKELTDSRFASVTLDTSRNRGFFDRNLLHPRMKLLLSGLSPAVLRIGGTGGDCLHYETAGTCPSETANGGYVHATCKLHKRWAEECLNSTMYGDLLELAATSNVDLVFQLNAQFEPDGPEVRAFLEDTIARTNAINRPLWGIEYGNELKVSEQLAAYIRLDTLLKEMMPDPTTRPRLIGPDQPSNPISRNLIHIEQEMRKFVTQLRYKGVGLYAMSVCTQWCYLITVPHIIIFVA